MDCFTFASYIHQSYTGQPFDIDGLAIQTAYQDGNTLDLLKWAIALKLKRLDTLEHLALVIMQSAEGKLCLGTVVNGAIAYMGLRGSVIRSLDSLKGCEIAAVLDASGLESDRD